MWVCCENSIRPCAVISGYMLKVYANADANFHIDVKCEQIFS